MPERQGSGPTVAIVDCGSGNLRSVAKAFERVAEGEDWTVRVTGDPDVLATADRVVLPGVGAFADCMAGLDRRPGMRKALADRVLGAGVPFLGICVGMQMMVTESVEYGRHAGLGWFEGTVARIPSDDGLRVPHMGWNDLTCLREHPVFEGLGVGEHFYFVHSYRVEDGCPDTVAATVDYGGPLVAALARDNMVGTQFHPEKSQLAGLRVIANYLRWSP